jgi:hypothetical protein
MFSRLKLHVWHATQPATEFASAHAEHDQRALDYLVPRKFESLEVWLLLLCGVYGLLVAAFVVQGGRDIMLACVSFICMAVWRRYHPARNQTQWTLGALVALLIVGWIYLNARSGGSTGPFLFLLVLMAMAFPLLMDKKRLLIFAASMLALYFATGWKSLGAVTPADFVIRGVLLAGICAMSGRFGMVLRQAEHSIDRLRHDMASLAFNEHGLARYGARLLHMCDQEQQPCTLVLLPMPRNWHEPIEVSGHGMGNDFSASQSLLLQTKALREMAQHLIQTLPHDAVVSRNAQGDWVLLVPRLERPAVLFLLENAFGRPLQLPFGPSNEEMFVVLTPCAVVSSGSSDSLDMMVARALDIWLRGVRSGAVDAQAS